MAGKQKKRSRINPATQKFIEAENLIVRHPMFEPLMNIAWINRSQNAQCPENGYACVADNGVIHVNPKINAEVEAWIYILAHCLLHLGFEHFKKQYRPDLWNLACDIYIAKFLDDFKLGKHPNDKGFIIRDQRITTEEQLYENFLENGVDKRFLEFGTAGLGNSDMIHGQASYSFERNKKKWKKYFGIGLRNAVSSAVNVAAGKQAELGSKTFTNSAAQRARAWFMSTYPLLGSLASNFKIIEDQDLCRNMDISVAAVNSQLQEVYINPSAALTENECVFVIAHELLHVGLRHDTRQQGRDHFLWNAACDYVINGWLFEMQIGEMPAVGSLYDSKLKGESAESVYDIIATDLRRIRKLATYKGIGGCDMLDPQVSAQVSDWNAHKLGTDLDSFYRRCLMQGLEYHYEQGRGYLPAGLVEEVRALAHPPIPWDVALAQWFDGQFEPLEKIRSYARPSRRQSGSPDIPRPRYMPLPEARRQRTFAVLLDTSGSMDRNLLARALGAITSFCLSRDVSRVRLVFCDAAIYDQGFIAPEELLERVKIKGRGGTVLQPGIDLLQKAQDFPKNGPILIITDGGCDILHIKREHAFLIPAYGRLPFAPRGKVFRMQ